jgi:hypothetical protein
VLLASFDSNDALKNIENPNPEVIVDELYSGDNYAWEATIYDYNQDGTGDILIGTPTDESDTCHGPSFLVRLESKLFMDWVFGRDSTLEMMQQVHQHFEDWIRAQPEDWFCSKRIWPKKTNMEQTEEAGSEADTDSYAA